MNPNYEAKLLNKHPHVFDPIQVGPIRLKNRILGLPFMDGMPSPDGMVTPELLAHVRMRAKSGAAVITLGDSSVDYSHGVTHYTPLDIRSPKNAAGLNALADEAHRYDCRISIEMQHGGIFTHYPLLKDGRRFCVSLPPKSVALRPDIKDEHLHVMTHQDIKDVVEMYAESAYNLMKADFDMCLVHSGHGWLLWQFLSPTFNRREDEYGGSLENRMRFPLEVFKAVREAVGNKMAIDMRVTGHPRNHHPENEMSMDDLITYLKAVSAYADSVNVSASAAAYMESGAYMCQSYYLPHKTNAEFARTIKSADTGLIVSTAGSFVDFDMADEWIASGGSDIVGMARALLADDKACLKAYRGQDEDIRPCIRCAYCTNRLESFEHVRCTVNPFVGRMDEYPYQPLPLAPKKKRLMIIGGGIAGMEAAQLAAKRGHEVLLYEKNPELGGMLTVASALPDKYDMRRYLAYMIRKTYECAAVHLNTIVTPELVKTVNPDAVLVAIGAIPSDPPIPGLHGDNVVLAGLVDNKEAETGDNVVVAGAGLTGTECAVELARQGKTVTVIGHNTPENFLADASGQIRQALMDVVLPGLSNLKFIFNSRVTSIEPGSVFYTDADGNIIQIAADTVVNALGMTVDEKQVEALINVVPESFAIGDCNGGRKYMLHATESALAYVMEL